MMTFVIFIITLMVSLLEETWGVRGLAIAWVVAISLVWPAERALWWSWGLGLGLSLVAGSSWGIRSGELVLVATLVIGYMKLLPRKRVGLISVLVGLVAVIEAKVMASLWSGKPAVVAIVGLWGLVMVAEKLRGREKEGLRLGEER